MRTAGVVGRERVAEGFEEVDPNAGDEFAGFVEGLEFVGKRDARDGGGELRVEVLEPRVGVVRERGDVRGGARLEIGERGAEDALGEGMEREGRGKPVLDEEREMAVVAGVVEEELAKGGLVERRERRRGWLMADG